MLAELTTAVIALAAASGARPLETWRDVGGSAPEQAYDRAVCTPCCNVDFVVGLSLLFASSAIKMEGTCTGEHGVGIGKKAYLPLELGETTVCAARIVEHLQASRWGVRGVPLVQVAFMRKLKLSLDPDNLLNPGKVVDIVDLDAARAAGDGKPKSSSSTASSAPGTALPAPAGATAAAGKVAGGTKSVTKAAKSSWRWNLIFCRDVNADTQW
jgi:hypothetical protein